LAIAGGDGIEAAHAPHSLPRRYFLFVAASFLSCSIAGPSSFSAAASSGLTVSGGWQTRIGVLHGVEHRGRERQRDAAVILLADEVEFSPGRFVALKATDYES
jgi:hypothetical protein